ncbi:penicillin-binding protein [Candidatus Daviesbacteria bacterium]|nr:penicillin-binding protein [Candidatus Daviesbacteria bacterium]
MPKGKRKLTSLKTAPQNAVLLLVQIILIKIGQGPLIVIKLVVQSLRTIVIVLSKARLPSWHFPHYQLPTLNFLSFQLNKKRGRPRKYSLILFYLNKLRLFFRKRVTKKTKISFAVLTFLLLGFLYTWFILSAAYQLPSPDKLIYPNQPLTTTIYDRGGVVLFRLYEGKNRSLVKLEDLPSHLIQATVASEDKNFYKHRGVDFEAIIRAFFHNLQNREQQGASTITQQLIKNTLLTPEKTYTRKVKEIILSLWAESIYSKNQILQMYFNEAPYGGPTWGIAAASQTYFGKELKDLTLAESSFLAGLPASPSQFSPYGTNPQLGLTRQKQVLEQMVEQKYITNSQMQQALSEKLKFRPAQNNIKAPHFVFYIKDLLSQIYGPRVVSQGGLNIQTTLDFQLQKQVEKIVAEEVDALSPLNVKNGAAMITDAKTGQILAMVGSKDYDNPQFGNFNANLALRQPGSSIKVITYATAFKQGYNPGNTILDTPVVFRDNWGNTYAPVNYDGAFHGPVSIRIALGSSLNIPAVKMLSLIGLDNMIQTAKDLGITTFDDPGKFGLSLTLGGGEVKMIEMMGAYGTFSQNGNLLKPTGILKVTDSSGNTLQEYQQEGKQVLDTQVSFLINHILSDNQARTLAFGPDSLLNLAGVAVKTGTSDNKRDNWTFGYTNDFVVGVWVGNNDNSPMDPRLASGITGAAPIWHKITQIMLTSQPARGFIQPAGVIIANIDGRRDLTIAKKLPKGIVRIKNEENKTIFFDDFSSYATSSAQAAKREGATN